MEKQHNGTKHVEQEVAQSNILDNFDQVVNQLRGSLRTLEDRVNKRTRDLEIAAEVAKQVSTYLELDELLPRVVNLTRDSFGLYHAHIYLASLSDQNLVLAAGAGEAGQKMAAQRHRIPMAHRHSLVARAARSLEAVIVNDVTAAPDFLPNPMLPDTKSELALPMIVGQALIGVLDLQSDQFDRFNDEDVQVMSSLASQIAIAVQNAQAFTERRHVEEALQALTQRLEIATTSGGIGVWDYDIQNNILLWDEQMYQLYGTTSSEFSGAYDAWQRGLHPDDRRRSEGELNAAIRGEKPFDTEFRVIWPDGTIRYLKANAIVLRDNDGTAQRMIGVNSDISDRKEAEEALRDNHARLSEALNIARMANWEYDVQADQFTFNDQFYSLLNTSSEEQGGYFMASGEYAGKFVHPEDAPLVGAEIGKALQTTDPNYFRQLEHRIIRGDGSHGYITVRFRIVMDDKGRVIKTYGANQDITESKLQQEEINRRAVEIETVAEVGAQIAQNLDLGELLWSVANLTAENFHYYYAQVYLLDDAGENLVLAAGSGEVGEQLVAKGHSIPLNRPNSLVARAGRSHKPVVINDVRKEADFLPNQLLPETRAELAVPILLGNQLIGVLDVQDNKTDVFGDAETQAKMVLANQIAVAVQNARAFEANQESQRLLRTVIDSTPDWIFAKDRNFRYVLVNKGYADGVNKSVEEMLGKDDLELGFPEELVFGNPERGIRGFRTDDTTVLGGESIYNPYDVAKKANGAEIVLDTQKVPLRDGNGNIFAVLGFARDITQLVQAQDETRLLYEASQSLVKALSREEQLDAVVDFPRAMGAISGTLLYMDNDDQGNPEWVEIVADWQRDSGIPSTVGARYYLPHFPFSKLWMANPNEPAFISDILTDKRVDENTRQAFSATGTRGAVLAPLYLKNQWVGMLSFSWDQPVAFDERSKRIIQSLGQQAASSVYAARLLEQVQKRASDMETVAQVSAAATTVLDVNDLLRQVSDLTKERFDLYHSHVYLLDDSGKNLLLAAGAGEAGRLMKERGHRIPLGHENSLVASAARNREGVIANDVTLSPDFLPNPLLPDTRSEMAIPMVVAGELIGVLDVQSRKTNHFTAEDVRIQTSLADQIAVAVQNARSFVQVQAQAEIERQAAERLREVDRLKSEFLANMSHELRTPLNSIIGYSEVLLDGVDGELTADAVEDVEAIHGSGQHLLSIINDILDLAKIEAGQMQVDRKELAITKFLQEIVHAGQILVRDKDVKLELEEADNIPNVYADPIRLRQIIWNLVSNAVKFTEKGSVTISVGKNEANNIYVKVRDTGIGMDKEQLPLIFEQFRQVDGSSTRRAGGTGLGLTITRHLVRMHQGEIHVDSKPGNGSTFWFTLPVYQPEHIA